MVPAETCERLPTGGEVVTEVLERMRFWFLDEKERQYQERCLMVTQEAFEKERLHWEAEHARVGEYTKRERRLLLEAFSRNRRKAEAPPPKPKQWKFIPRAPPCFSKPRTPSKTDDCEWLHEKLRRLRHLEKAWRQRNENELSLIHI